ncbi:CDP-glycerol glycerophosphotransferase family protein [Pediococcus acidilactici]
MSELKTKLVYSLKKNVALKGKIKLLLIILQFPVVMSAYIVANLSRNKDIWLIGETGTDAKDNGFAFFRYLRKFHKEIEVVYYISSDSHAKKKVEKIGTTVETNSFKHKVLFMSARYILSTHDGYSIPFFGANWREFKIAYGWLVPNKKFVFLNHGVNKDDTTENANYNRTKFDYHVTTTEDEFKEMSSQKYGYPKGNIIKTGLARYDYLTKRKGHEKNIVYMPTWRYYLADASDKEFISSKYFKKMYSLMHNKVLLEFLAKKGIVFYFFPPHHEIQRRIHLFDLQNTGINVIDTEESNFSKIVSESSMMITDFSSVIFDFAYLYKRTAYYQFDTDEYRSGHYKKGYFDYERDGFGPILTNESAVVQEIIRATDNNFKLEPKYEKRIKKTFEHTDNKNSERLFNILKDDK